MRHPNASYGSEDEDVIPLRRMRIPKLIERDQCFKVRTALVCLWGDGAISSLAEAGPSDATWKSLCSAVGIPVH